MYTYYVCVHVIDNSFAFQAYAEIYIGRRKFGSPFLNAKLQDFKWYTRALPWVYIYTEWKGGGEGRGGSGLPTAANDS